MTGSPTAPEVGGPDVEVQAVVAHDGRVEEQSGDVVHPELRLRRLGSEDGRVADAGPGLDRLRRSEPVGADRAAPRTKSPRKARTPLAAVVPRTRPYLVWTIASMARPFRTTDPGPTARGGTGQVTRVGTARPGARSPRHDGPSALIVMVAPACGRARTRPDPIFSRRAGAAAASG